VGSKEKTLNGLTRSVDLGYRTKVAGCVAAVLRFGVSQLSVWLAGWLTGWLLAAGWLAVCLSLVSKGGQRSKVK
jgi:hypothetical protein